MIRSRSALVLAVLGAACSHTPEPMFLRGEPVRADATPGSAADFVPLVAPSRASPRCEDLRDLPAGMGPRVVSFIFGDGPEQRIAVTLGEDGIPRNYSDMRGDLNASDGRDGDLTAIAINLVQGHAFARNRPEGGTTTRVRMPMEEALYAESLGQPQAMMDRILAECAG